MDNLFGKNPRISSLKLPVPYEKDTTIDPIPTMDKIITRRTVQNRTEKNNWEETRNLKLGYK